MAEAVTRVADTDDLLIERCRSDDRHAFNEIVLRYQDRLLNYVRRMVANPEDAEDLAQETFVRAYAALKSFQSRATFHTWLFRIATNLCIDYRRRQRQGVRQPLSLDACETEEQRAAWEPADETADPAHAADRAEFQAHLNRAIRELPERLRAVIVLHDIEGLPYDEIAAIVGCPLGTVKSRLFHARMAVRKALLPYLRGEPCAAIGQEGPQ